MERHKTAMNSLKVARGQIEATIKMLEDDRYCIDVSNQISATMSLLKKAQKEIISQHLNSCVIESFEKNNASTKIKEIEKLLEKIL